MKLWHQERKGIQKSIEEKTLPSLVPEIIQFTKLKNPLKETSLGCRLFFHPILPEKNPSEGLLACGWQDIQ